MAPVRVAIAPLSVVALLAAASAQTPASPQPPPRPTFRVEANFVRVDAYPTADGRPVEDLTAADFELLENGEPQAIETFERVVVPLPGPQSERIEPNTINPQGLEAGATPAQVDWIIQRTDSLKILADNTDGVAIVNTNNLPGAMPRIVSDLSSYYLIGYYSSIGKLDGSFRRITVRVKRPGVSVRARRGYRAATIAEVSAAATAAGGSRVDGAIADAIAEVSAAATTAAGCSRVDGAIADAIGALSSVGRGQPLRVAAAMAADGSAVWVTGELDPTRLRAEFRSGGEAVILLSEPNGPTSGQAKVTVPAGRRSFTARIGSLSLRAGRYEVMVRASAAGAAPLLESASVTFKPGALGTALLFRRGPLTTQPFEPVADPQFRRTDTLRVQVPVAAAPLDARITLLDRNGQPLNVSTTPREIEEGGVRWIVGDLPLASLAAGDYVVQIEAAGERRIIAFRVA